MRRIIMDTETLKIIGEIVGAIAIAEGFFIFLSSKREKIIIFKFISDLLWLINQLLIGGYTGAVLNGIAAGRECVFYNRDKKKWATSRLWLFFFLAVTLVSPTISLVSGGEGWYAILPAIGSCASVIGFDSRHPNIMRYMSFVVNTLWRCYNVIINNVSATVSCVILLLSALIGTVNMLVQKKREREAAAAAETPLDDQQA